MGRLFIAFWATVALAGSAAHAQDNLDVAAAGRSVVRLIVADTADGEVTNVGTGSGVAVAPDKVLTNAHVVSDAVDGEAVIGVVPSEGHRRFTGKLVAIDPDKDLALVQVVDGRIEPATIASGPVPDGAAVAALGYPYSVDRARELSAEGFGTPEAPVKSWGHVSAGHSSQRFDTVLHDAAIGRGNSGGPLVDACGRVVGINSFVSNSEGVDAVFAFAVSTREILPFLRKAGVQPRVSAIPCRTSSEQAAIDEKIDREQAMQSEAERAKAEQSDAQLAAKREQVRDAIEEERDRGLAIAGVLLVFGALAVGGSMVLAGREDRRLALGAGTAGLLLMAGAVIVWASRPHLADVDTRLAAEAPKAKPTAPATGDGAHLCRVDLDRSRITVSDAADVPLTWTAEGCANDREQFADVDGTWTRASVSPTESTATVERYDPEKGRYTVEHFLLDADTIDKARAVQGKFPARSCGAEARNDAAELTAALKDVLPPKPNERLVYGCGATK